MQKQSLIADQRYEVRSLRFKKDRFELKVYDCENRVGQARSIAVPPTCERVPTRHFGYVGVGAGQILLSGGQFADDKTCSVDTFEIVDHEEFRAV